MLKLAVGWAGFRVVNVGTIRSGAGIADGVRGLDRRAQDGSPHACGGLFSARAIAAKWTQMLTQGMGRWPLAHRLSPIPPPDVGAALVAALPAITTHPSNRNVRKPSQPGGRR